MDLKYIFKCGGKVNSNDVTIHNKDLVMHQEFADLRSGDGFQDNFDSRLVLENMVPSIDSLGLGKLNRCMRQV